MIARTLRLALVWLLLAVPAVALAQGAVLDGSKLSGTNPPVAGHCALWLPRNGVSTGVPPGNALVDGGVCPGSGGGTGCLDCNVVASGTITAGDCVIFRTLSGGLYNVSDSPAYHVGCGQTNVQSQSPTTFSATSGATASTVHVVLPFDGTWICTGAFDLQNTAAFTTWAAAIEQKAPAGVVAPCGTHNCFEEGSVAGGGTMAITAGGLPTLVVNANSGNGYDVIVAVLQSGAISTGLVSVACTYAGTTASL